MSTASATYGDVLRLREFRTLVLAQIVSVLGDQMSKVALTVLVFDRTGSTALTAAAYASTFLPWLLGGPLLSTVADRYSRREVLVVCDVGRAAVLLLMAVPGVPLWLLFALLFTAELMAPPFDAARAALLPDVLEGDRLLVGSSVSQVAWQGAQVAGFALGGPLVVLLSARGVFALDAVTFVLSAFLVRAGLQRRPSPRTDTRAPAAPAGARGALATAFADSREAVHLLRRLPHTRTLVLLGVICASAAVVPEGLASPYVAALGAGPDGVGLLMAAGAIGTVTGAVLVGRLVPARHRDQLVLPLAALSLAPLTLTPLLPGLALPFIGWMISGIGMAFLLPAAAMIVREVPPAARGRVMGLAQSGIMVGQGAFLLLAGLGAAVVPVGWAIAVTGLVATLLFLPLWRACERAQPGHVVQRAAAGVVLPHPRVQPDGAVQPALA